MINDSTLVSSKKNSFRYDINALRTIAVIGVVFYHFDVPFFGGGFSGVDMFFVISGYLMSKIVINGLASEDFSIIDFYNRRGQRIVPALLCLILIVLGLTFFMYLPLDYADATKNAVSSILFYSNILYSKSGYFDAASENNIFLHTWSLSVEWQFYLILPVALMLINRFIKNDKSKYLILFSVAAVLLFIGSLLVSRFRPTDSFYLLPTRAWEMLVGGIAFLLDNKLKWRDNRSAALLGYVILAGCLYGLNNEMLWPGWFTLLPVFGTFLIIVANYNAFGILRNSVVEFIGKISYSLYLWHWPIFVIAVYLGYGTQLMIPVFIILSFLFAFLSYKFVETSSINTTRQVLGATALMTIIVFSISRFGGNEILFKKQTLEIDNYLSTHQEEQKVQFSRGHCFLTAEQSNFKQFNQDECIGFVPNHKNYILIGDSHAAHLSQSLKEAFRKKGYNLMQSSATGCLPIIETRGKQLCKDVIHYMYDDFIPNNEERIDGVIISGLWSRVKDQDKLLEDLRVTLKHVEKLNIPAIIIGDNETYTLRYASIAAREYEYNTNISDRYLDENTIQNSNTLDDELGKKYIDILNLKGFEKVSDDNIPYISDTNHFTKYGADCVIDKIMEDPDFKVFLDQ